MAENQNSFEQTALVHLDAVLRTAMALCGRREMAEDLTQATYVKALERFGTFRPGSNAKAWLFQILRNHWVDHLRHLKVVGPRVPMDEQQVDTRPAIEETSWSDAEDLLENFSDAQVIQALTRLPEDQRMVLYLVDVEQLSHQEVSEIVDVAVGTIKSRTSRARAQLRQELANYAQDMGFINRRRGNP
ncbi:RNA polymerase sigma factor [Planctomycetota bacterium]